MKYFSDLERQERGRLLERVSETAWGGIRAQIVRRIENGAFGRDFPHRCIETQRTVGTDINLFEQALKGEVPELGAEFTFQLNLDQPLTLCILDMLQFCWKHVANPNLGDFHKSFGHHHLVFDCEEGQRDFVEDINLIFHRNGLAFELKDDGHIERLAPPILGEQLDALRFNTPDDDLNLLLDSACSSFLNPDYARRYGALKDLWDAFERLKTLHAANKKTGAVALLDNIAGADAAAFRSAIEKESLELTRIGNAFQIRHSETSQERLTQANHVDYLFHRLFAFIWMAIR